MSPQPAVNWNSYPLQNWAPALTHRLDHLNCFISVLPMLKILLIKLVIAAGFGIVILALL